MILKVAYSTVTVLGGQMEMREALEAGLQVQKKAAWEGDDGRHHLQEVGPGCENGRQSLGSTEWEEEEGADAVEVNEHCFYCFCYERRYTMEEHCNLKAATIILN